MALDFRDENFNLLFVGGFDFHVNWKNEFEIVSIEFCFSRACITLIEIFETLQIDFFVSKKIKFKSFR